MRIARDNSQRLVQLVTDLLDLQRIDTGPLDLNLASLQPQQLVPGRGAALQTPAAVAAGLAGTRAFIADVYRAVQAGAQAGKDLKTVYRETLDAVRPKYGHWVIFDHCMPFDVTRAYDEATAHRDPRIWTAERDIAMWKALES